MFIFLDESGDLGFDLSKAGASKKFVITLLVCQNKHVVRHIATSIKRTLRRKLNHKNSSRVVHELKGTGTTLAIKQYWYRHLPQDGWEVYTVTLNKARVKPNLTTKTGKKKLYNFLARFILEKLPLHTAKDISLVVDKCHNRAEVKDFNHYIESQLQAMMPLNSLLYISHESSQDNAGLQAVDLFCWGIYRKYEHQDMAWYQAYKGNVGFETEYLR